MYLIVQSQSYDLMRENPNFKRKNMHCIVKISDECLFPKCDKVALRSAKSALLKAR